MGRVNATDVTESRGWWKRGTEIASKNIPELPPEQTDSWVSVGTDVSARYRRGISCVFCKRSGFPDYIWVVPRRISSSRLFVE